MSKFLKELGPALLNRETYDIRSNMFALFGLAWGAPVPIMGVGLNLYWEQTAFSVENVLGVFGEHPIHFFFLFHPFMFMTLFGALGVMRQRTDTKISQLVGSLQKHLDDLNEANKQLRDLDKLKDEFLANVTHELRTPLVTIRGYTEMFINGRLGETTPKQERCLSIVDRNVRRLLSLIGDILSLSRLDRRRVRSEQKPFPLATLADNVRAAMHPNAELRGIDLAFDVHDDSLELLGLRDRVEQVFLNLISNAIKFTGRGGRITVSTRFQTPQRISVEVEDTGCGIPVENRAHIFDRFVQGDGSIRRRHAGAGLGLAIVREILEAHDCSIRVSSVVGKGTRFSFELPVNEPPEPNVS